MNGCRVICTYSRGSQKWPFLPNYSGPIRVNVLIPRWSHSFAVSARSFASQSKEDKILEASSWDEGFICPACPSSKSVSTTSAFFFFRWTLGGSFTRRMSAFSSATVHFWRRFLILSTSTSSSQFAQEAKKTPAAAVIPSSIPVLSKAKKIKELTTENCGLKVSQRKVHIWCPGRLRPVLAFCQPQWSQSCESGDYHGNTRYREMVYTHAPHEQHSHLLHVGIKYACITSTAFTLAHLLLLLATANQPSFHSPLSSHSHTTTPALPSLVTVGSFFSFALHSLHLMLIAETKITGHRGTWHFRLEETQLSSRVCPISIRKELS